jgi:hypothetical protein
MQTLTSKLLDTQTAKRTSVTDRVKSFEDACRELGIAPSQLSITGDGIMQDDLNAVTSYYKMMIIIKALNGDWVPDFSDKNQAKYYPWFEFKKGSGFVLNDVHNNYDYTSVGARLCFKSSELAKYAATQFSKEYNEYLTYNSANLN